MSFTFGAIIILNIEKKSAEKSYFCWECCKQGLKRNKFVIMGIEPWYWFQEVREKQKYHGEFDHVIDTSGTDVLCTIPALINQKQNKTRARMHRWSVAMLRNNTGAPGCQQIETSSWAMERGRFAIGCDWNLWLTWENLKNQLVPVCPGS